MALVPTDIGAQIDTKIGLAAQVLTNGSLTELTGSAIDRANFYSCSVNTSIGACSSSTLTGIAATVVLKHATTSTGSYSAFTTLSLTGLASTATIIQGDVNLNGAYRYLKVYLTTPSFTAGAASCTVPVNVNVCLGGSTSNPV